MSIQIIKANPSFKKEVDTHESLYVSEFFCDTIQGENFIGAPCAFLRLQHCTLRCCWCDTKEVWRFGNPYSFKELFTLMEDPQINLINKLLEGQHLVFTGGSPLRQQNMIVRFIQKFMATYHFKPFIEIENECTINPIQQMVSFVNVWNNSPKLSNSGNLTYKRYNPQIIKKLGELQNSWFKFVITSKEDWEEIVIDFLIPKLINKDQIVLMPQGSTRKELMENREFVVNLAIKNNVRYTTREHIILWDKKTGV